MSELMHEDIQLLAAAGDDRFAKGEVHRALADVVPPPPGADVEKLEQTAARHRVLIFRGGAVIALTTLISVGGALLIHAVAAGVLVIGLWFPSWIGARAGG